MEEKRRRKLRLGDTIVLSPVGMGKLTGKSPNGYPEVNGREVSYCENIDGLIFDPKGSIPLLARWAENRVWVELSRFGVRRKHGQS